MRNPIRRNRKIGTRWQGRGKNNRHLIPWPAATDRFFFERLGKYQREIRQIHGRSFVFVIEENRTGSLHTCSVDEVASVLALVPPKDLEALSLVVFRQPTRRQEVLSPVWGRLIYSFDFEGFAQPAIILEAISLNAKLTRSSRQGPEEQAEFQRLLDDGHLFKRKGNYFIAPLVAEACRRAQLYRTLPHEIGHYVHYLQEVQRPNQFDASADGYFESVETYFGLPAKEHEAFAHRYVEEFKLRLGDMSP